MSKTKDLTTGNPGKVLLAFSIPILLGNLFQQLYATVDSIVVGQFVGAYALGAVGTAFPITFIITAVASGLSNGAAVLIGQSVGSGKNHQIKKIIKVCIGYAVAVSLVLTLICYFAAPFLLNVINASAQIYDDALTYLKVYFLGLIFTFSYNMVSSIFRALGDSKTPLVFLVISSIANIVLDLYFVLNYGWGVFGVAFATVIAQAISFGLQMLFLASRMKHFTKLEQEGDPLPSDFGKTTLKTLLSLAVPSTLQEMTIGASIFITQALVNQFGPDASSAYTACGKIENFAMMPMINMAIATTVFTAQNMGAKQTDRVKTGFQYSLLFNLVIGVVVAALLVLFPRQLMHIFLPKETAEAVMLVGVGYLQHMAVYIIIMAVLFATEGVLRGSGDMKVMIYFASASTITKIVASVILINFFGIRGIWIGAICSWSIETILALLRVVSGKWKEKTIA